jgi:hypothetical protein
LRLALPKPDDCLYKRKQEEYGGSWAMAKFIEATETSEEEKRKQLMYKIVACDQRRS